MIKSIKVKYAIIFSCLLTFSFVIALCANILFLAKFYKWGKQDKIVRTYEKIGSAIETYSPESEEFKNILDAEISENDFDILIINDDMEVIVSSASDDRRIVRKLLDHYFKNDNITSQIEKNQNYSIQLTKDPFIDYDFMDLWGTLPNGDFIYISSSIESMKESARASNKLFAIIGAVTLFFGIFIVYIISKTVTKPILELVKISDKMSRLEFDTKYKGNEKSEIGLLGRHINKLSDELEKTISELKKANNELKNDLDKRVQIDDMRTEFLSNVSHELKTPIALIQGYAEGLKDCVNDDAESRDFYCDVIIDEAGKMNALVKNLLNLNELEFSNDTINYEQFDIVDLINNCIISNDILIKQNNINVIFNNKKSIYVWSDEFRIEQVVSNYISNAIHYCEGADKIIRIDFEQKNDKIRVNIFNSGKNIPDGELDKVWVKFYKVDKARTREYGGSGVGLSIVKASMSALNQDFGVYNNDDGVTFYFEVDVNNN